MSLAEYVIRWTEHWDDSGCLRAINGNDLCGFVWQWTLGRQAAAGEESTLRARLACSRQLYSLGRAVTHGAEQERDYRRLADELEAECLRDLRNYQARQRRARDKALKEAGFSK